MKLRPHHLLCIQKYTGSGYNEGFVSHMNGLIQSLKEDLFQQIELVCGGDDVCTACPCREGGTCASAEKTARMDHAVLSACGFSCGQTGSWASFAEAAVEAVLSAGEFERICADCQWFELCVNTRKGWLDGTEV